MNVAFTLMRQHAVQVAERAPISCGFCVVALLRLLLATWLSVGPAHAHAPTVWLEATLTGKNENDGARSRFEPSALSFETRPAGFRKLGPRMQHAVNGDEPEAFAVVAFAQGDWVTRTQARWMPLLLPPHRIVRPASRSPPS